MKAFPIFVRLAGQPVLLVGDGSAAAAKARLLLAAGARVFLLAAAPDEALRDLARRSGLTLIRRGFRADDLADARLVIVASDDPQTQDTVAAAARARGVPVNVVDAPALSDFVMPAIVHRDGVVVAIGTSGAAPALARKLRATIEALLPARIGALAAFAARFRDTVRDALPEAAARRRLWDEVFDGPLAQQVLAGDETGAARGLWARLRDHRYATAQPGRVALVGAGPGNPELLTLRAHRLLQQADVIVHDRLAAPAVLDLARRDARRIDVGKWLGRHGYGQDEINALLVKLARDGHRVVRLKGGDPTLFARGGEELAHLRAHGIAVELVPGITAATGCAAAAGFALTQRGQASAVTLMSGQAADGGDDCLPDLDWAGLARGKQTLVVYMGVRNAGAIAARLIEHGRDPATPVAVIENGTRADQRTLYSRLDGLAALLQANAVRAPALLVIGTVVGAAAELDAPGLPAALLAAE